MKPPLRVPVGELKPGTLSLPLEVARYVTRVHRAKAGQLLSLFDPGRGLEAEGVLLSDDERDARVEVREMRAAVDHSMPVTLFVGLGKADKPEQAIRDATVLGARRLVFVQSERSVAKLAGARRAERFARVAVEAARQCGRAHLPTVEGPSSWEGALTGGADAADSADGLRLVATLDNPRQSLVSRLAQWSCQRPQPVDLLIGPEGGLAPDEIERAFSSGFRGVRLTNHVLRTETAVTVALGVLAARWIADD